jgi:hypothetical protein
LRVAIDPRDLDLRQRALEQLGVPLIYFNGIAPSQYTPVAPIFITSDDRFRENVLRAYRKQCAVCRLRETTLLQAAHIIEDLDPFCSERSTARCSGLDFKVSTRLPSISLGTGVTGQTPHDSKLASSASAAPPRPGCVR